MPERLECDDQSKSPYTYSWLHIPSGKRGTDTQCFYSSHDFLIALNRWNGGDPENWHYWATATQVIGLEY